VIRICPGLEKRLGRPLTDWDWQVYREEKAVKQQCMAWFNTFATCYRQLLDREKIHGFVWEEKD